MLSWLSVVLVLGAGPRRGVTCLAAAGECLAIGGHGGVEVVPVLEAGIPARYAKEKRFLLGEKHNTFALALSGDIVLDAGGVAGERGEVRAWDWKRRALLWQCAPHEDIVYAVAVVGKTVFTGSADKTIAVLDVSSGGKTGALAGHAGAVLALAASPDGKLLASGGTDSSVRLWDTARQELRRAIHNHGDAVHALAWSPDGSRLASGSADRSVRIWEAERGRLLRIVREHEGTILALAYTTRLLVSGASDGKVRLIDPAAGAVVKVLEAHRDWVAALAVAGGARTGNGRSAEDSVRDAGTPDVIISGDWQGRICVWEDGGARMTELEGSS